MPDGEWIGFDSGGMLRRIRARRTGGDDWRGTGAATATWLADGSIVFATNTQRALRRMPAAGGEAVDLTMLDAERGDTMHLQCRRR
ncbi:MAG: hypothetical protein R2708_27385 [Vicinamibacterales bacterium]